MGWKDSRLVLVAVSLAAFVASPTRAEAALIAYICDDALCAGGNDVIATDGGAGDSDPGSGVVGLNAGGLGGFAVLMTVSQSKPVLGSAAAPELELAWVAVTTDALTHTVFLYMSDTGFTGAGAIQLQLASAQPGGPNTVRGRAWGGNSNNNLDFGVLLADTGASGGTPVALSAAGVLNPLVNPYALTIGAQVSRGSAGASTGHVALTAVPEPRSVVLFGLGVLGYGAAAAARRTRTGQRRTQSGTPV